MSGWTKVTLRIASEHLSPEEIEAKVGDVPSETKRKGDPVSMRNPGGPQHRESICSYVSPRSEQAPPEEHLRWLLTFCEAHRAALGTLPDGCTVEAWLGYGSENGQGGFALTHEQMLKLG